MENSAAKQRENVLELIIKRIAPVVLAVSVMMGAMVGCADSSSTGTAAAEQNKVSAEEIWAQAVADEKETINNWYKEEIASPETLRNLFNPDFDMLHPKAYCKLNSDHLPTYVFTRSMIDIPELIASYYEALDKVSVEDLSIKSLEDSEKEIEKLRKEFGIICDAGIQFVDIPTFASETEEMKDRVYYIEGRDETGIWHYNIIVCRNLSEVDNVYSFIENYYGEKIDCSLYIDAVTQNIINESTELSFDTLGCTMVPIEDVLDFRVNDEPVDLILIHADDIMEDLVPIFAGDEEFKELCEDFGIKGALEQLKLLEEK